MPKREINDWKDIAAGYYEKAVSLAILILLFAFLVSPKMEVKAYKAEVKVTEAIDIPQEIKEKIKPPETMVKPVVEVVVDDELEGEDDEDIEIIETIETTSLDAYEELAPTIGTTSKFAVYEDPPVAIKRAPLEYPAFAKQAGIQGQVWLEVEVLIDGSVGAVEVKKSLMSGPGGLDEAAINSVRKWKFEPAKSGGKPVACWVTFPVTFSLK